MRDEYQTALGGRPFYIPSFGKPGKLAAMTTLGTVEAFRKIDTTDCGFYCDYIIGRAFLQGVSYSPGHLAGKIAMP